MADAVTNKVVFNGQRTLAIMLTCISDGTGEADVIKIDKSTLTDPFGREIAALDLEEIYWSVQGFSSVRLEWDHDVDDVCVICGETQGYQNYKEQGNNRDPRSTGGTGDVILTSVGATATATYSIFAVFKKSYQ